MSREAGPPGNGTVERAVHPPVPPVEGLSVAQTCGRACVWCAVTLTTENAVELGTRSEQRFDTDFVWFPRSCRLCAEPHAYRALLDHIQNCEQCADETARCVEGHALRQTLKEVRR
ncbi:hypothetical protein [Streptomyces sp. MZ04]|uniref:hypothetical protein n=1 Tax=Streptomyces sp. MZ04 TaxID=2559236 RepID=UPI00107E668E|nr:hypothetical protein [Streptomyces sp. MZ04]TGB09782.1 hypothetical protein E2651_15645 [Streptomyces sp. MZ04]